MDKRLKALVDRREKIRRKRERAYRRWKKTGKGGYLGNFRRLNRIAQELTESIVKERKRLKERRVISREEWGAAPINGSYTKQPSLIAGVQHHSAIPALKATATVAEEKARMRQIQAIHLGEGWTDIAYAFVAFPSGRIYEGRPVQYVGAHTLGHNTGYAGWCLDGNYETSKPTKEALQACHRMRKLCGVADKPLYGHFQLTPTACPGRNLIPSLTNGEI